MISPRPSFFYHISVERWGWERWENGCHRLWSTAAMGHLPEHAKHCKLPPLISWGKGTTLHMARSTSAAEGAPGAASHGFTHTQPRIRPSLPGRASDPHVASPSSWGRGLVSTQPTDCSTCLSLSGYQHIHQQDTNPSIVAAGCIRRSACLALGAIHGSR